MLPYRHIFDASATRSADLPGAIIEHCLRDQTLSVNRTVFIESLTTGLLGMGLAVFTPDVTPPNNTAGAFAGSVATGGSFTATATFNDAGTVATDVCPAILYVTKNSVLTKSVCATTSAFGSISISYAQAGAIVGDVFSVIIDIGDAAGNWLLGFNLGSYTCK